MSAHTSTASRQRSRRRVFGAVALALAATSIGGVAGSGVQPVVQAGGAPLPGAGLSTGVVSVDGARYADTRLGGATFDGLFQGAGARAAASTYEVDIAGRGAVPESAIGAVINVTAVDPAAPGFFTVYDCKPSMPNASALNYTTGVNVANEVVAGVSDTGTVCVYTSAASDLLVDVVGYVLYENSVKLLDPARIAESRVGATTVDGKFQGFGRTAAGGTETIRVAGRAGVPMDVSAAILNVAAVDPDSDSFITVHACLPTPPAASSLNHTDGVNRANELITPLDALGNVCVYTAQDVDLIVDVVGYVEPMSDLVSLDGARYVETRPGATTFDGLNQGMGKLAAGSTTMVQIADRGAVPAAASAAVINVAAVDPDSNGFFTVDACNTPRPNASSLNYTTGVNGANEIIVPLSADGKVCVYTQKSTHLIVDVVGYQDLVTLQLLAFNDFHGHMLSPDFGRRVDGELAGGAENLATQLNDLRVNKAHSLTVAAGDLIGGSPAFSGLFHDEPAVESMNAMELDVSGVGNHEFDEGITELLRMQDGGCHPVDGCYFPGDPFAGADFQWLAANVVKTIDDTTPLPPYEIKDVGGIDVAFIGMTLEGTDELVAAAGIAGYEFKDEADTANALVPELQGMGVEAIIVLLHEGASQTPPPGDINACKDLTGPILAINDALDPAIDAMVTGHTHLPYNCRLADSAGDDRIVTSAYSFGRVVSDLSLPLDRRTGDVIREASWAMNHAVLDDLADDPDQTAIIDKWQPLYDVLALDKIGETTAAIERGGTPPGDDRGVESAAGNLVADAQLWATSVFAPNGAEIAFMNPGGVRSDLPAGDITFGDAFGFQPFGNTLFTMPMTGAEIEMVLEEQCKTGGSRPFLHLGVSDGFTYDLATTIVGGDCTSITVSDMKLGGVAIVPGTTYMVTVNGFLADGGDGFDTFGTIDPFSRIDGGIDLDGLIEYFKANSPVAPPSTDRVTEL